MNRIATVRPESVDLHAIRTITDPMMIENYLQDESTAMVGEANVVYVPTTEAELAAVLRHCYETRTPVTTSGAGTGLTCSRVPLGGVVLSTEAWWRRSVLSPTRVSGR